MPDEMTIDEIMDALMYPEGVFPCEALEATIEKREQITPKLLELLEYVNDDLEWIAPNAWDHIFAVYLLAQFREGRAYPLIVELFSTPGEAIERAYEDVITEDLGRILASVSGGDPEPIKRLVEDSSVNEWVRGAAMNGLVTMVCAEQLSREEVIEYFRTLYAETERESDDYLFWSQLVSRSCDLYPEELQKEIKQAFADDLVDPMYIGWESVEYELKKGKSRALQETCDDSRHSLIDDTIKELEYWAAFRQPKFPSPEPPQPKSEVKQQTTQSSRYRPATPSRNLGRNDPCWCGSGRKYKHCHWREDQLS